MNSPTLKLGAIKSKKIYKRLYSVVMIAKRRPSPTGIQHKSLGIPNGIWNLDLKSGRIGNLIKL